MTRLTATTYRLTAAAALVLTTALTGAGASAASTGQPTNASDDHVTTLLAKADAARPYSQADDYVDTLVYWHQNPKWGFGS
jgi:hypothetical protein